MKYSYYKHLKDERGYITVFFIFFLIVLIVACALAVDIGGATVKQNEMTNVLQLAREEKMTPSATLEIKNADDPGQMVAEKIVTSLRQNGYNDEVDVYFYEVDEDQLLNGEANRVYGYSVVMRSSYDTIFAGAIGSPEIEVAASLSSSANPYSEYKVWRPDTIRNGCWSFAEGAEPTEGSYSAMALSDMPVDLQNEITNTIDDIE